MLAFLKSDLFLRFLGGFAIGAVGMFLLQPEEAPMLGATAIAATSTNAPAPVRRSDRLALIALAALAVATPLRAERAILAPVPTIDAAPTRALETAVFAGGCYWGVEGVFSHVKGVQLVVTGFAGGPRSLKVDYEAVSSGDTGYAEAVRVTYDPQQVSYGTLLRIFFSVIADPTTLNYQVPDHGTQYRGALFPLNDEQAKAASAYLVQLGKSGLWRDPVATKVERFTGFQNAARDHQDFMRKNPRHPYIARWDVPKLAAFKAMFPAYYRDKPSA